MEPANHPFRKENYLPNLHDSVPAVNLQGCILEETHFERSSFPWGDPRDWYIYLHEFRWSFWFLCTPLKFNKKHLKMGAPWKKRFLLETIIFRFYVVFFSGSVGTVNIHTLSVWVCVSSRFHLKRGMFLGHVGVPLDIKSESWTTLTLIVLIIQRLMTFESIDVRETGPCDHVVLFSDDHPDSGMVSRHLCRIWSSDWTPDSVKQLMKKSRFQAARSPFRVSRMRQEQVWASGLLFPDALFI